MKDCEVCNATKPSTKGQTAPMGKYRDPKKPFKMISMDYMGPVTTSSRGHKHIVVVIDNFSKFVIMKPLRLANAATTIDFLKSEVFYKYGVPAVLISDNGPQLRSTTFAQFLSQYNVRHWRTPAYHAQANATEAANKTIMAAVRAYTRDDRSQRGWDLHLPALACALNSAVHTATKYSPYKILYGYDMITDGQLHVPVALSQSPPSPTVDTVLATIRSQLSENLRTAYENAKRKYDTRANTSIEYVAGQTVWKRNTRLSNAGEMYSSKLDDKSIQCTILRKTGTNTYALADTHGKEIGIFSTKMFHAGR